MGKCGASLTIAGDGYLYVPYSFADVTGVPPGNVKDLIWHLNLSAGNGPLVNDWDYFGDFADYILNNVCQSTPCN